MQGRAALVQGRHQAHAHYETDSVLADTGRKARESELLILTILREINQLRNVNG
jgi:hypothetical protein